MISSQKAAVPTLDKWDAEVLHLLSHAHLVPEGQSQGPVLVHPSFTLKLEECGMCSLTSGWMTGLTHWLLSEPRETVTITACMKRTVDRIITSQEPQLIFLGVLQTLPQPLVHSSQVTLLV